MSRIGGRRPTVFLDAELVPKGEKFSSDLLGELQGLDSGFLRGLLYFLAMLINPGQKEGRPIKRAVVSGDDVGQNFLVRVPDMRLAVSVINCCGNEVFHSINRARFCRPMIKCEPWRRPPRPL